MIKPIKPMLAEVAEEPFDSEEHYFEPKLDGVRALAFINQGQTRLQARNLADISPQFPELLGLHRQVDGNDIVLDGEIVCLDPKGFPSFEAIQGRVHKSHSLDIKVAARQNPSTYMVFDTLYVAGESIMDEPLSERKKLLARLVHPSLQVQVVKFVQGQGIALFNTALEHELEGIVAKETSSPYLPGKRSTSWLKIKTKKEGVFVIGGLTRGEGAREDTFGALALGTWGEDGKLYHVGNVGTGFSDYHLREILKLCQGLETQGSPFANFSGDGKIRLWCRPVLQCEVRYLEMTTDGKLRTPAFRGLVSRHSRNS